MLNNNARKATRTCANSLTMRATAGPGWVMVPIAPHTLTNRPIVLADAAEIAVEINSSVENIGARRLQTVMERILDDISFTAPDRSGETIVIDAALVRTNIGDLAKNADLSRFIL